MIVAGTLVGLFYVGGATEFLVRGVVDDERAPLHTAFQRGFDGVAQQVHRYRRNGSWNRDGALNEV